LTDKLHAFRHWVGEGSLSDHLLVFLEVKGAFSKPGIPFKFNASWLLDASFISLFHNTWKNANLSEDESCSKAFIENLTRMKVASKQWALQKKLNEEKTLENVNLEITLLEDPSDIGYRIEECRA